MSAPVESNSKSSPDLQVSLSNVVKFVRQLAHDLRNHLNAAELQSAYLAELAEDAELKEEINRLRAMVSQVGSNLQSLTAALSPPRLTEMRYSAADFLEDLQQRLATEHPDECASVQWNIEVGDASLQIDPQVLLPALTELFANAFRHGRGEGVISVEALVEGKSLLITIREPKRSFERSTENWGREPMQSLGQGHYGLGLHRSRAIIEAHRGQLNARYDSPASSLLTTVVLPLAEATR